MRPKGPQPKQLVSKGSPPKILTPTQIAKLMLSLGVARGRKGFSNEDAVKIASWAEWTALQEVMLRSVLSGLLVVNNENTNPDDYSDITFVSALKVLGPTAAAAYLQELEKVNMETLNEGVPGDKR